MSATKPARALFSLLPPAGPQRVYAMSVLVGTFGFGLIMTATVLYATQVVHLSSARTGLALTIAGLVGLLAGIPMGDLADRRGPREMVQVGMLGQFAAAISFLFIRNFAELVIVATVDMLCLNAVMTADSPLLRRIGGEEAAGFRASTNALANLGMSLGLLCCAIAIQINTPNAYRLLYLVNALAIVSGVVILGRLPRYQPLPKPETGSRLDALKDGPFVAFTVLGGAMFIENSVIPVLLPLWVVYHTHAPRWSISLFALVNTLLVVLFQVRVGQNVKTILQGGTAMFRAGVVFLLSCSVMGLASGLPGWAAVLLLVAAVALHTYGEIWHTSGMFALEFGLPPAHAQGQYQGLAGIGTGLGQAAAPVLLVGVCLSLGLTGFVALGACFAALGLIAPALARWGQRTRPAAPESADAQSSIGADQA
jgi:MFS family permease